MTLMAESEEEQKSFLMKVKEEKCWLKTTFKKKIMASDAITSWQIDGKRMETVRDFVSLDSKITVGGNCSLEIKRCLFFGRKAMTDLEKAETSILPTKVHVVKAIVFLVVMCACES